VVWRVRLPLTRTQTFNPGTGPSVAVSLARSPSIARNPVSGRGGSRACARAARRIFHEIVLPQSFEGAGRDDRVDRAGPIGLFQAHQRRQRPGQEELRGIQVAVSQGERPSQKAGLQHGGRVQALGQGQQVPADLFGLGKVTTVGVQQE
jgi:hypothetical protein